MFKEVVKEKCDRKTLHGRDGRALSEAHSLHLQPVTEASNYYKFNLEYGAVRPSCSN